MPPCSVDLIVPQVPRLVTRNVSGYTLFMILKVKHKGLKKLQTKGDGKSLNQDHVEKLEDILTVLDAAKKPADVDIPGYDLHPLRGDRKGEWSVTVSGNWRVTFKFDGEDVTDVHYEDYH